MVLDDPWGSVTLGWPPHFSWAGGFETRLLWAGNRSLSTGCCQKQAMDVTKPYDFLGFGAMDVTKPHKFIGFGTMAVTKPYKFIGFGACGHFQIDRARLAVPVAPQFSLGDAQTL